MSPFAGSRTAIAARLAADIPGGWCVNLGIGLPTLVANHVPLEREVLFHSENGVLGFGPAPAADAVDPWLINAGKQPITLRPGAALMHQADSFGLIRGGHIDLCVLGAFEVAANGDLANWSTSSRGLAPAVGGAMDLAAGAKQVWTIMEHRTKSGAPRLVERCSLPLTAVGVVKRVYTDLAVLDVTPTGFAVIEIAQGLDFSGLQAVTGARLYPGTRSAA